MAYSRDGRQLVTSEPERGVKLWDVATQGARDSWLGPAGPRVDCRASLNLAGTLLAAVDVASRQEVAELRGHTDYVKPSAGARTAPGWSPDPATSPYASGTRCPQPTGPNVPLPTGPRKQVTGPVEAVSAATNVVAKVGSWYSVAMEPTWSVIGLLSRVAKAAKALLGIEKPPAERPPAMIGLPPSARGLTGRPPEIARHAQEVAREWEDVAENFVQKRMRELGIPDHQIGAPDYDRGGVRHAFLPDEPRGGTNDFAGRLYVDSGVLNPDLDAQAIGPEASALWAKSRLRDRTDAVIAHEHQEGAGIPHNQVVVRVAETVLPISENARRILRSIAEGEKRRR